MKKRKIVFLTGAGISQDSGIPTFRDSENSLWSKYDVNQVANISNAFKNIEKTNRFFNELKKEIISAKPNASHYAIAQLQKEENLDVVVLTQNIDDFHIQAGSPLGSVLELHGNIFRNTCRSIPEIKAYNMKSQKGCHFVGEKYLEDWNFPQNCPHCQAIGTFSPDVVLFGEALEPMTFSNSIYHASEADLFIQVGTSLNVFPVSNLLEMVNISKRVYIDISDTPSKAYEHKFIGNASIQVPIVCELIKKGEI